MRIHICIGRKSKGSLQCLVPSRNLQSYTAFALPVGKTCPVPKRNNHWVHSRLWHAQAKAHPAILVLEGESWVLVLNSHWKTGSDCFPYWFQYLLSNCRLCKDQTSSVHPSLRFGYHSAAHSFLQLSKMSETGRWGGKTEKMLFKCWFLVLWWWAARCFSVQLIMEPVFQKRLCL